MLDIAANQSSYIESSSASAEANCRLPGELITSLAREGLFAVTIGEKYGGLELPALDSIKVLEQLAYADASVGWCGMIFCTTAHLGSFLPESWGNKIFGVTGQAGGYDCPLAVGAAAPMGKGQVIDGGILVSGRWPWGSGSHHANWICGGTLVEKDGELLRNPGGDPTVHVMFFERSQVTLHDNWNPSGLRGTGSVDFEVTDQLVPEGRWTMLGTSRRQIDSPLFRFPFFGYFAAAVAAIPLGIGRRAVDDFEAIARGKVPTAKKSTLSTSSITQLDFGRAESLVEAAHTYLYGKVDEVWQKVASDGKVALEDKRQLRLAAAQATIMCADAVDLLYKAAGGTALQGDCPLQKHFRDIHAATQHRMVSPELLRLSAAARLTDDAMVAQL